MSNPFLEDFDLPPFDQIQAEHFLPAITQVLAEAAQQIDELVERVEAPDWDNFLYPLESIGDGIERVWSTISNLNAVCNTPDVREAYGECLPLLTEYSTRIGQHEGLFERIQQIRSSDTYSRLSGPQQKMVDNMLRDFKLSGIGLEQDKKVRFSEIKSELAELTTRFSNNVLDATQAWQKVILDKQDLPGLPATVLESAAALATSRGEQGYLFTLDIPSYLPVMQHCENRELREEMYRAYVTRASEVGPNASEYDNQPTMQRIMQLRKELAELLGFANYAERSLATKMAETTQDVLGFLDDLAERAVPIARREYQALCEFAAETLNLSVLEAWDIAFASEKLREAKYSISQEELKPYFPADTVIAGMFDVVQRLYGIEVRSTEPPSKWHDDVRFYEVYDKNNQLKAKFYLDLFAREGKRGGAWMADCQGRRRLSTDGSAGAQIPVAFLTCNFTAPSGDKPSLLTHNEVTTLFHEFGHGLHHMLTEIDTAAVAGIAGVAWDAVELPSQFMENWCWEEAALQLFAKHYETGESLPKDLLDKMLAAKNFQSAMQMVRQLEFSLFDFLIHRDFDTEDFAGISETLQAVRQRVAAYETPAFNRFENAFSHIFAGGYAAGYYSYKWAEVLSADAYSLFEEKGIFDRETGLLFKRCVLEMGGSEEPAVLFKRFRGRAASTHALLRHSGIVDSDAA